MLGFPSTGGVATKWPGWFTQAMFIKWLCVKKRKIIKWIWRGMDGRTLHRETI